MKILLVDDSRAELMLLSAMLSEMGHEVLQADCGEKALKLFLKQPPDMVLMDVVMPGMDGYEAVREMRRLSGGNWLPILFITVMGKEDDVVRGIEAGGDDYLHKPVHFKILRAKIDALQHHLQLFRRIDEQSRALLDYQIRKEEEQQTANEFMNRLLALDKIDNPLVHFHLRPADVFSGDLIAVASAPTGQCYVMLADGTGHGLTAALAVMPVLHSFHAMAEKGYSIGVIAAEINRKIREYFPANRFVAAALAALDAEKGRISVWNGGCPPAVLLGEGGKVIYQYQSSHLPLGVLSPEVFDDAVTTYHYGNHRCQLLLCSDGALGCIDAHDVGIGMKQFLEAACVEDASQRLPAMVEVMEQKLAGSQPDDDIAMVLLDCPERAEEQVAPDLGMDAQLPEAVHEQPEDAEWQLTLVLTARQLRQTDIVPMVMQMVSQIECEGAHGLSSKLFLVLSELINNALDHGLLEMDSSLKDYELSSGMDRYFEERAKRLSSLTRGEIRINLEKVLVGHEPCLKVSIADTGKGFDHSALRVGTANAGLHLHGRGIKLVANMGRRLSYSGRGNRVSVCLPLSDHGQCASCQEGVLARLPFAARNT